MLQTDFLTVHNYDLSIIIPLISDDFFDFTNERSLRETFEKNGVEVILVLPKNRASDHYIDVIKKFPFISWQLLKANTLNIIELVNSGILNSKRKFIGIYTNASAINANFIYQLNLHIKTYNLSYVIGVDDDNANIDGSPSSILPAILLINKSIFKVIKLNTTVSFISCLIQLNCELQKKGYSNLYVVSQELKGEQSTLDIIKHEIVTTASDENIETLFDWQNNPYAEQQFLTYVSSFIKFSYRGKEVFNRKYQKLLLVQCFNEEYFIPGFLKNVEQYFDGIIFLDDSSTDNSYELFDNNKVLIKLQKSREKFNDLENRNILLDCASFLQSDWICFMDIDERIDSRYDNFEDFISIPYYRTAIFSFVHIWDEANYKVDFPNTRNGIFERYRMFKSYGRLQILSSTDLHFSACPYFEQSVNAKILINHLGASSKKLRDKKYDFYINEDRYFDKKMYSPLKQLESELAQVSKIRYINHQFINPDIKHHE